jgi:hypothetical protein
MRIQLAYELADAGHRLRPAEERLKHAPRRYLLDAGGSIAVSWF